MIEARIIRRTRRHSNGGRAVWFEIETIHNGIRHRSHDHAFGTEQEARLAASEKSYRIDPKLYVDEI